MQYMIFVLIEVDGILLLSVQEMSHALVLLILSLKQTSFRVILCFILSVFIYHHELSAQWAHDSDLLCVYTDILYRNPL